MGVRGCGTGLLVPKLSDLQNGEFGIVITNSDKLVYRRFSFFASGLSNGVVFVGDRDDDPTTAAAVPVGPVVPVVPAALASRDVGVVVAPTIGDVPGLFSLPE